MIIKTNRDINQIINMDYSNVCKRLDDHGVGWSLYDSLLFQGVVTSARRFGKIAFFKVLSTHGAIQVMVRKDEFSDLGDSYKSWVSSIGVGDHIKVHGYAALTKTSEPTLLAHELDVLEKARSPFPDKWHGVSDEAKRKLRYQETIVDHDVHSLFVKRSKFIRSIRRTLERFDFLEVDTPILHNAACGAQARSFVTNEASSTGHSYNLRIAPETYLKRMTAGGFHKVFEIGKQFRNEGVDSSHMPEFTSCEWYEAYTTANDQLRHFKEFFFALCDDLEINTDDLSIVEVPFRKLYDHHCPFFLDETPESEIDSNFKKYVRPALEASANTIFFVTDYPAHLAPLARRCKHDSNFVEMWQMIWKGQEVVKCYTELTDPVLQRQLLEEQVQNKADGSDDEAMELDEAFLQTMEFGMPPQSGLGFGVDRMFALLYGVKDIRDTVFFPFGQ